MATDRKISDLDPLAVAPEVDDLMHIVDVSEPLDEDKNKRITVQTLFSFLGGGNFLGDIVLDATATLDAQVGAIWLNESVDMVATSSDINQLSGVTVGGTNPGDIVTIDDAQALTSKTMDADLNTFSNFEHGAEVDNPSSGVHGVVGSVVGTTNGQVLTNKTMDADLNTFSNFEHGAEVDNPSSGVHGVTGNIVGTTDIQTLSNKTLTTPTIGDFTNAQHDHSNAANGGSIVAPNSISQGNSDVTVTDVGTGRVDFNLDGVTVATVVAAAEALTIRPDADFSAAIGRARLGDNGIGDTAAFGHYDHFTAAACGFRQLASGIAFVNAPTGQSARIGINNISRFIVDQNGIRVDIGATINEFSTDGSFASNSDTALPTERAVKTYVDDIVQRVELEAFDPNTPASVGDGKVAFVVSPALSGYNLTGVIVGVHDLGTGGTQDVMIRRRRAGANTDMLSTPVTVDPTEYYANDGVISLTGDDVQTGDLICVDIDAVHSTTPANGTHVTLEFSLP